MTELYLIDKEGKITIEFTRNELKKIVKVLEKETEGETLANLSETGKINRELISYLHR